MMGRVGKVNDFDAILQVKVLRNIRELEDLKRLLTFLAPGTWPPSP
jgi:hypothetical protein